MRFDPFHPDEFGKYHLIQMLADLSKKFFFTCPQFGL